MASWSEVEAVVPELASQARDLFEAHTHHTLATLRKDGSPRISGIEVQFGEGELWLGSMWRARKALDLQRDPRFALHSASSDPPDWQADAKLAGRVEEITDPKRIERINGPKAPEGRPSHLFRLEIAELVVTGLDEPREHLVIESWHPGRGIERHER